MNITRGPAFTYRTIPKWTNKTFEQLETFAYNFNSVILDQTPLFVSNTITHKPYLTFLSWH